MISMKTANFDFAVSHGRDTSKVDDIVKSSPCSPLSTLSTFPSLSEAVITHSRPQFGSRGNDLKIGKLARQYGNNEQVTDDKEFKNKTVLVDAGAASKTTSGLNQYIVPGMSQRQFDKTHGIAHTVHDCNTDNDTNACRSARALKEVVYTRNLSSNKNQEDSDSENVEQSD
jgi:hypothetical protein